MARSIPISRTKIILPQRRPELVSRPRLLEGFRAALGRRLVLLCAPAGYGKTSLLLDFAHSTDMPVCWLSLDALDRDPQRFLAYLMAALAERFPRLAVLEPLLNELKSIERDAEPFLVELTNELHAQTQADFVLVLDDFHLVDDVQAISALLNRFVQLVGENCRVVLSSRIPPALPDLSLMLARGQVHIVGEPELAFRPGEIQAFYGEILHRPLSDRSADELAEQTGGWITGIILKEQSGALVLPDADAYAYLSRQVLDQQPEMLRLFLLRTSLAEEFDAKLCEAMLASLYDAPQDWDELINEVVRRNLFVLPLGGTRERWVRYHPLFREFLQGRLREERSQEVETILQRLVGVFQKQGEWEKAHSICEQVDDPVMLADLVEASGSSMLNRFPILEAWFMGLPNTLVRKRPGLLSLLGAIEIMKGDHDKALDLLCEAIPAFRLENNVAGLALALVRRAFVYRLVGRYVESVQEAEQVLLLTGRKANLQAIHAEAFRVKGLSLHRLGKTREACEYLEQSLTSYKAVGEPDSIRKLLSETALARAAIGDRGLALARYRDAWKMLRNQRNYYGLAGLMNNLAVLHHQMGEYELAVVRLEEGLVYARRAHHPRAESLIFLGLGDLYAELELCEAAGLAYQSIDVKDQSFSATFAHIYWILARANLAILKHDAVEARRILRGGQPLLGASPSHYERSLLRLLEGRILIIDRQFDRAISTLRKCRDSFVEDGRKLEILWARLWLAAAAYQNGESNLARNELREVLRVPGGIDHYVVVAARQARPWLSGISSDPEIGWLSRPLFQRVDEFDEELPRIRRQIRRIARTIPLPPPRLVIHALGRAEVRVGGKAITLRDWRTQSVRELFFYLMSAKQALSKEQIGEGLWPETSEPSKLKQRFKNELYRLRRALGQDLILFDGDAYRFNQRVDYEYDVEAFEAYLARASVAETPADQIELYSSAVELVHGSFLQDIDTTWVWPERERLNRAFLSALLTLASLWQDAAQFTKALDACRKALEFDPACEAAYRRMMQVYHQVGDRQSVIGLFSACEETMRNALDLPPSVETQKLYRELVG